MIHVVDVRLELATELVTQDLGDVGCCQFPPVTTPTTFASRAVTTSSSKAMRVDALGVRGSARKVDELSAGGEGSLVLPVVFSAAELVGGALGAAQAMRVANNNQQDLHGEIGFIACHLRPGTSTPSASRLTRLSRPAGF